MPDVAFEAVSGQPHNLARLREQYNLLRRDCVAAICRPRKSSPLAADQARPVSGVCVSDWRERNLHRVRQGGSAPEGCGV